MSNSAPNVRLLSHGKPLPNAHNAAFTALALGKADLISVVVAPRQSNDAAASVLACRFASQDQRGHSRRKVRFSPVGEAQ